MRISDWSSDVCSSDLAERRQPFGTLDSIKTTRLLYLRYGNGEIAVPLESGGNEGLQLRISEELPPADFHRPPPEHPVARVGGGVIPRGRQRWPRVRRGYPARAQKRCQGEQIGKEAERKRG